MNRPQIKLAGARNEMQNINKVLQGKCGPSYKLELLQYRYRDTEAAVYDETSNEYDIILCLYHNNKCVSSVTGRYNKPTNSMELLSKTDVKYEGLKYNLYLRTVFIYLMFFVRPTIEKIYSHSTNPISTYAMYKHYHATNDDLQEYVKNQNLTPETFTLSDANNFHAYFGEKYKKTPESAQQELDEMLEDYCEMYNMDCGVEDLGWETKEEAIQFIMTTMNLKAITLALDLGAPGGKEFLTNKLLNIDIKCGTTQRSAGGKVTRSKSTVPNKSRRNRSRRK